MVAEASVIRKVGLSIEQVTLQNNEKALKVKKCYKTLHSPLAFENNDNGWKEVWQIRGPLRLNLNLWFARHTRLSTAKLPHKRKVLPDPTCPICHSCRNQLARPKGLLLD